MAKPRVFASRTQETLSEAGVYHVVSRVVDRRFIFEEPEKAKFLAMMRGFAAFHQVEVLTFCLMGNHFHLLIRVPQRPAGFDLPFERVMELMDRAVGPERMKLLRSQFRIWESSGSEAAIEEWRQRMLARMFSLSEFMKALKQRFTQWYNRRNGRDGTLWGGRYRSVIVEDEARALRAMGTYIDLNPVRAGIVEDPGDYRWSGYAAAMTGNVEAMEAIAQITGATAARAHGQALNESARIESASLRRRRHLRALTRYRQMLGVTGRARVREDGTVVRRGLSERVQKQLEAEGGVRREQLLRRVKHFTHGVIIGSRAFIDAWFERNRGWFGGKSQTGRKTGARRIGRDWNDIFNLRQLRADAAAAGTGDAVRPE